MADTAVSTKLPKFLDRDWEFKKVLWIGFFVSILFRFVMADFPRIISVYADELDYYQMAQSYAQGRGFCIYNFPTYMDRFLYSLILSLAFRFQTTKAQLTVIALLNSIMINLSVFPMALLIKEMIRDKRTQVLLLLICFLFPDLAFSMTFMSENLFYPVSLFAMYFSYLALEYPVKSRKFWIGLVGFGISFYIAYYVKSTALVLGAGFAVYAMLCVAISLLKKGASKKNATWKILTVVLVVGIIAIVVIGFRKFTLPGFLSNIQGQFGAIIYYLKNGMLTPVGARAFTNLWVSFLVAVGFAPLLYMLFFAPHMDKGDRRYFFYIFTLLFILLTYNLHFSTAVGQVVRSILFRYICFIWLPMIITFAAFLEKASFEKTKANQVKSAAILVIILICSCLFRGGHWNGASAADQTVLSFVSDKIAFLWPVYAVIMFAANVYLLCLLLQKDKKATGTYLGLFLALCLLNTLVVCVFYRREYGYRAAYDEDITDFVCEHPEKTFIIVENQWGGDDLGMDIADKTARWSDMHLNFANTYKTSLGYVKDGLDISEQALPCASTVVFSTSWEYTNFGTMPSYDYLLVSKASGYMPDGVGSSENLKICSDFNSSFYDVYENQGGAQIPAFIEKG